MDVIEVGGGFMISTVSGKTDYSVPERKMLNDLLKNAKVSEEGHRYKVIPIGGTETVQQPRDIFSVLRNRDSMLQEARATLNKEALGNRSNRAQTMANHFRNIVSSKLSERITTKAKTTEIKVKPDFRTASDKQDENTQWVIPAKEMDMTGYLMDMNKRIQESIYTSVTFIIESYEKEFA